MSMGASKVDVRVLAYGSVLEIPIVTDDADMISLATTFGVETWGILKLLRLMFDNQHIDIGEAKQIVNYLDHDNDLPYKGFIKDFFEEFGIKSLK